MTTTQRATGPLRLLGVFYAAMAAIALYGQSDGLMTWLGVNRAVAVAVGLAVELLAAVLLAFADWRRTEHGEQAIAVRALSVAVALGVAALNFYGHDASVGQRMLFTGASLAAYGVWTFHSNARRRDNLRAAGRLAAQPPVFGLAAWLRAPRIVWRARTLAVADPALSVHEATSQAADELATAKRHKAIAAALRRKLKRSLDGTSADIAMVSYDLDKVAARLARSVDYDRLTGLLAADIDPGRIAEGKSKRRTATATADTTPTEEADTVTAKPRRMRPAKADTAMPTTAEQVARLAARNPELSAAQIAGRLGISERTARRYMPKPTDDRRTPDRPGTVAEQPLPAMA
jgi:hypothetical protein